LSAAVKVMSPRSNWGHLHGLRQQRTGFQSSAAASSLLRIFFVSN
jgi:hypothetical protein